MRLLGSVSVGLMMRVFAVISHLSTGEHAVSEEMFQNTLRYIFSFIDKVRFFFAFTLYNVFLILRYRNDKPRTLLKNFVNGSDSRRIHDNGVILHSACHCYRSRVKDR